MENQIPLTKKVDQLNAEKVIFSGINSDQFGILYQLFLKSAKSWEARPNLFIFENESKAKSFLSFFQEQSPTYFYPGIEDDIYSSIIQPEVDFNERLNIINRIVNKEHLNIITTLKAGCLKTPPEAFFKDSDGLKVKVDEIYEFNDLATSLVAMGYQKAFTVEEPGTFAIKGEIFDIFPPGLDPVRINFFDTIVESIHEIDPLTLVTKKNSTLSEVVFPKTGDSIFTEERVLNFKNKFPRAKLSEKALFSQREKFFESLKEGRGFENYQLYLDYFFEDCSSLFDISRDFNVFIFNFEETTKDFELYLEELSENRDEYITFNETHLPKASEIFFTSPSFKKAILVNELNIELEEVGAEIIPLRLTPLKGITQGNLKENIKNTVAECLKFIQERKKVILCSNNNYKVEEIKKYFEFYKEFSFSSVYKTNLTIENSFVYEDMLFLSDNDFFTNKKKNQRETRSIRREVDLFAEQLSTLKSGDHVIHNLHGIGIYRGIETITLGDNISDYLVIEYQDQDKVYVPVYKFDLVQKYSSSDGKAPIANLKQNKFEAAKKKARESVKKLAFSLIEFQARRKIKKGYQFSEVDKDFQDFSLSFPYTETTDQEKAINDVIDDMTSPRPMDRLVCGDVGFGKTEVAMRAAYKAVLDGKQVAMLVPTTILSYQHHNSFIERFKNFPVSIESVSRLRTAKEVREIATKIEEGKLDILIGTHKILSSSFKFHDLGLLIIDEEQRFGVAHKERLRLLRENIDTLTMTATPIPRTLQMSFLGIKELSLIKTPPARRQSIKTYIVKEDRNTLKLAIEKELNRNGQIFIVHNKVSDIEIFSGKIRELVPKARIVYAHGQMPEKELEKRIAAFYKHEYDILISTTIIESGIDIPNANTMIIDRADTFGLSQLHQLRGRIGRSNRKAYAYFVVPKFKKLSDISRKRLKALQTFAELGSGFSISSSDLEIRGAGDILGAEQSGHINNIGLELYMDLLQEAINEIKGTPEKFIHHVDVQASFNAYIPSSYIESNAIRLKIYKQLSSVEAIEDLESKIESIHDQYGQLPVEFLALITVIKSKVLLKSLGIDFVKVQTKTIIIRFNRDIINSNVALRDKIIQFFSQRPKIYKINPDYSINCSFKDKITTDIYLDFVNHLKNNLE